MAVQILSVATNLEHIGAQNLIKSANYHNETVQFIGVGETWGGWRWRMEKYRDAIRKLSSETIVVCIDAYDVLITDSLHLLPKIFENLELQILVSSDSWCFGRNCKYIPTFHQKQRKQKIENLDRPYVCMGIVAGRARAMEQMYSEILESGISDDQIGLATYLENHAGEVGIELDDDEILACNITGLKHFDPFQENISMFTHFPSFVTWTGFSLAYRSVLKQNTKDGKQYPMFGKYRPQCIKILIGLVLFIFVVTGLKFFH